MAGKISELLSGAPAGALGGTEAFELTSDPGGTPISKGGLISQIRTYIRLQLAIANGFASLNSLGKVPASQRDNDVVEYANLAAFPGTGTIGIIHVALDTNLTYTWDDDTSVYILQTDTGTLSSSNIGLKTSCRLVATSNVNIATGGVVSIDGKNTATGYRILLTGQTAPAENGIYVAAAGAWSRAADADTVAEIRGALVMVWQGTTYGSSLWVTTFKQGNTLGTTAMNWYRVASSGNIVAMIDALLGSTAWQSGTWGSITGTLSAQTDLQTALDAKQPLDGDLTAIAALAATSDNFMQAKAGAWASRTPTQVTADLNAVTSGLKGLAPASGGGIVNFLRADGSWQPPASGGNWGSITGTLSSQADLQAELNAKQNLIGVIRTIAGTTDTPTVTDAYKYLRCTSASAVTITIPTNAAQAFAIGQTLTIEQAGAGAVTLSPSGGVILDTPRGYLSVAAQYGVIQLKKVATDTWTVLGDLGNPNNPSGTNNVVYWIRQVADRAAFVSNTTAQAIFDTSTAGSLSLGIGHYEFSFMGIIDTMSATAGNGFWGLLGAGTATLGSILQLHGGRDATPSATLGAMNVGFIITAATAGAVASTATATVLAFEVRGSFEVTVAGTIIPSFALDNAAACVVKAGTWMSVTKLGDGAVDHYGWS